ncbi:MAG TPA: DUF1194 domain-containing protein [Hyphomicrobiaceae bacterium]|nr:DUF1194 domain-containing protein [Hyphomicrobiaceae bacterium]
MRLQASHRANISECPSGVAQGSTQTVLGRRLTRRAVLGGAIASAAAPDVALTASADVTDVDLVLMLAADISRSVDSRKFQLQRDGYAAALVDPDVHRAIGRGRLSRIAIAYMEWSGGTEQMVLVDWTVISRLEDARDMAERIVSSPRAFLGRTSISSAIDVGLAEIARCPYKAPRHLIDISGDGTHNSGRRLDDARNEAMAKDVGINAVVILSEIPLPFNPAHTHPPGGLLAWFETNVIAGEGAFAIPAQNFEDFGRSIRTKLIREISMAGSIRRA